MGRRITIEFVQITEDKRRYLLLLLDADPCEAMIDRYLNEGEMYALQENGEAVCVAVVVRLDGRRCELKNIAADPQRRHQGIASRMLRRLFEQYAGTCDQMLVGTSESAAPFYRHNGFVYSHTVPEFFTKHYPDPIFEEGVQCVDMVYFVREIE